MFRPILLLLFLSNAILAAPLRILALGDSLTEEYAFEFVFSAPDSAPTNANTRNWPELLADFRPDQATLGPYQGILGSYLDLRDAGHEWNFGVPGFTSLDWFKVLMTDSYNPFTDNAQDLLYFRTRNAIIDRLPLAEAVVIFIGGNDLKQDYNDILGGTEPAAFYDQLVGRVAFMHDWIRTRSPAVPIIVCTIPDVGATPEITGTYHDPVLSPIARDKIARLNEDLIAMADARAAAVARIDRLINRVYDERPFQINGTLFTLEGDPENPPDHVFCKDGFHPSTVGQALIANEIISALNTATGREIDPFTNREILGALLELNPDQPFLDWAAGYPLTAPGMNDDPDGDGLPNLVEMALATPPDQPSTPISGSWRPGSSLSFSPDSEASLYLELIAQESTDLDAWTPVPPERIGVSGSLLTLAPPSAPASYFRLQALPR